MLTIKHITEQSEELIQIESLYERAFPENERRPLAPLFQDKSGNSEVIAFYDDTLFCGFACLLTYLDISHIIYFSTEDALRGKGYGSAALTLMSEMKGKNRVIVDIEVEKNDVSNNEQRKKRKDFYLKNGYTESKIKYNWRHESYEILVYGGVLSKKDFNNFWKNIYFKNNALSKY